MLEISRCQRFDRPRHRLPHPAKNGDIRIAAPLPAATPIFTNEAKKQAARAAQGEGAFRIFGSQDELGYLDKHLDR
ncbi:MAG: hypothetical protein CFK52_00915 [Chloracidobacterium sp. CP2_5A]|nr:MAG: hypothetical protein CFK52_00915 [Chloracidobacterium sp. CP2_5A]